MNREIKFRVWDQGRSEMRYPGWELIDKNRVSYEDDTVMQNAGYYLLNQQGIVFCNDGIVLDDWHEGYEIMQYTGLKDKNGKEIFEGDIVKCSSSFGCPHEVVWAEVPNGNLGCYYCWYLSGLGAGYSFTGQEEIIGNIHESPHLLK